jgi:putative membrane protein
MSDRRINIIIAVISAIVPVVVALLIYTPAFKISVDVSFLPTLNAALNSTVTVLLLTGFYFIRQKKRTAHKFCMLSAFSLSALFLISYLIYHSSTEETAFGGTGPIKIIYYFILITHIILAAIIMPLVLFTLSRALTERFDKHRKIARITLPLWLYVSVSGVVIYFMISPWYQH